MRSLGFCRHRAPPFSGACLGKAASPSQGAQRACDASEIFRFSASLAREARQRLKSPSRPAPGNARDRCSRRPHARPRVHAGSLMRHVAVMTATGSIGLVAIFAVDVISLFWVSRLGVQSYKAAVGYASQLSFVLMSINIGLTIAISATVSRALGAGDRPRARRLAASGLVIAGLVTTALSLVLLDLSRRRAGAAHARAGARRERRERAAGDHHPGQYPDGARHGALRRPARGRRRAPGDVYHAVGRNRHRCSPIRC